LGLGGGAEMTKSEIRINGEVRMTNGNATAKGRDRREERTAGLTGANAARARDLW